MDDKDFSRFDDKPIDYCSLKVSHFDPDIPLKDVDSELRKLCRNFHPASVHAMNAKTTGESFAYINFDNHQDARHCMNKIVPLELFGSTARVVPNISKFQRKNKNIADEWTAQPPRGAPTRGTFSRGSRSRGGLFRGAAGRGSFSHGASFSRGGSFRGERGGLLGEARGARPSSVTYKYVPKRANHVIYLGSLPPDITESELRRIFDVYGFVEAVFIKPNQMRTAAIAFITYFNLDMARRALRQMSGRPIGGRSIKYGYGNVPATRCLWIGNIGAWTDKTEIVRTFERCGEVKSFHWPHGKNYAYIVYEVTAEAERACDELDGMAFGKDGKRVRLDFVSAKQIDSDLNAMEADFIGAENDDEDFDDGIFTGLGENFEDEEGYGPSPDGARPGFERNARGLNRSPMAHNSSREERKPHRYPEDWDDEGEGRRPVKKQLSGERKNLSPASAAEPRTRRLLGKTPPGGSPPRRSRSPDRNPRSNEEYFERNRGRGRGSYGRGSDDRPRRGGFVSRGGHNSTNDRGRSSFRGMKRPMLEERENHYHDRPDGFGEKRHRRNDRSPNFDGEKFFGDCHGNNSKMKHPFNDRDWSPESRDRGRPLHRGKQHHDMGKFASSQRRSIDSRGSQSPERFREDRRTDRQGSMGRRSFERASHSPDFYRQQFHENLPSYAEAVDDECVAPGRRFVATTGVGVVAPSRQMNSALYDPFAAASTAAGAPNQILTGISYPPPAQMVYPPPNLSFPPPTMYQTPLPTIGGHSVAGAFGMGEYSGGAASSTPDYPGQAQYASSAIATGADPAIAKQFPQVWSGAMVLKSSAFVASMYLISGSVPLVDALLRDPAAPDCPALKISQRLRLDEPQKLEELERRIAGAGRNGCSVLLATPVIAQVGDVNNVIQQRPLRSLGTYLHDKECAAVIYLPPGARAGAETGVMHAFPPCDFAREFLSKEAPHLVPTYPRNDHLLVIVMRETPRSLR